MVTNEDNIVRMYNPCKLCGNDRFVLFLSDERHKGIKPGTPCILCPCGRFGSTDNWNAVNKTNKSV